MKILCVTNGIKPQMNAASNCIYNILGDKADYICIKTLASYDKMIDDEHVKFLPTSITNIYKRFRFCGKKIATIIAKIINKSGCYKKVTNDYMIGSVDRKYFDKHIDSIMENNYDIIISVNSGLICNYIGRWIKEKYPNIPWIVYEVDPYVYNSNIKANDIGKRKRIAQELYSKCNLLFYMPGIKQYNEKMGYFPLYHKNSIELELPKLYNHNISRTKNYFNNNKINLVYVGIFYDKIRNPIPMFEIICRLKNVILHVYGGGCKEILSYYKAKLGNKFVLHGMVSNDEAYEACVNADVLVAIGNTCENQIPSKIFDYFSTGNSIINLMQIENDTSKKYMEMYGNSINYYVNLTDNLNVEKLQRFIEDHKVLSYREVKNRLSDCTVENIQKYFYKNINYLVEKK